MIFVFSNTVSNIYVITENFISYISIAYESKKAPPFSTKTKGLDFSRPFLVLGEANPRVRQATRKRCAGLQRLLLQVAERFLIGISRLETLSPSPSNMCLSKFISVLGSSITSENTCFQTLCDSQVFTHFHCCHQYKLRYDFFFLDEKYICTVSMAATHLLTDKKEFNWPSNKVMLNG